MTAGHCVCLIVNGTNILMPIGKLTVNVGNISILGGESHSIEKIYLHENFSTSPNIANDIAVLKVSYTDLNKVNNLVLLLLKADFSQHYLQLRSIFMFIFYIYGM